MHPRGQCDTGGDAGSNETARQRAEPGQPGRVRVRSLAARGLAAGLLAAVAGLLALSPQAEAQVNSVPTFDDGTSTSREFNETIGEATVSTASDIGMAVAATDTDTGDTLEYTLSGTDAAKFEIITTNGQIQTKSGEKYSYETDTSYSVTVTVEDGNGGSDTIDVTLNVTDLDEPPLRPAAPTVSGPASNSTTSLRVTMTAPDNLGRPPITHYRVRAHRDGYGWSTLPYSSNSGRTIANITSGKRYLVQFRVKNDEGEPWSPSGWLHQGPRVRHAGHLRDGPGKSTLTAGTSEISDRNGKSKAENGEVGFAYTYQWVRVDGGTETDISGETASTYTLAMADLGKTVKVTASFTDNVGYAEGPLTSDAYPSSGTVALLELSFAENIVNVDEEDGSATLTVGLAPAGTETVTVDYATRDSGAKAGEDYTATSGTLTFAPGEISKTITIPILNDDIYEDLQSFFLDLRDPSGTALPAIPTRAVEIASEDAVPTASMEDVTVDEGAGTMTLTLHLSHPSQPEISYLASSGNVAGTATEGDDFLLGPGGTARITVPEGELSQTFDITIVDDNLEEPDETIELRWQKQTSHVTPQELVFIGTIEDNDEGAGAAMGKLRITGAVEVGQMLTVSTSGLTDQHGNTKAENGDTGFAYTYQWYRVDAGAETEIPGATGSTYTQVQADEGKGIRVKVSFTDDAGNAETLASDVYRAVVILPAPRLPSVDDPNAIWMATLTVANLGSNRYGYHASDGGGLTDTAFTYLGDDTPLSGGNYQEVGTLYTIDELFYHTSGSQILLSLDGEFVDGNAANIFVDVGGTRRSFSDGTYSSNSSTYAFPNFLNPSWSAGEEVTVKIVVLAETNGPEDLAATTMESGDGFDVMLTWAAPTEAVTGYRVEYQPDPALQWLTLESNQSVTTYTDSGLGRGTVRYYRVAALRSSGASYSEIVRVQAASETAEVPEQVNHVDVKPAEGSHTALEVAWSRPRTPSSAPATGYHVQYVQHDGAAPAVRDGEDWATVTFPTWMERLPWQTWSGAVEEIEFEENTERSAHLKTVVTGLAPGTKYRVRVRGCTEADCGGWSYPRQWTTSGTTLNATEAEPLTATLEDVPTNHDGSSAFTFRIAFSAEVEITPQDMRDHALTVTGGTVTNATQVDGRSDLWELTVEPARTGAVSILVPLDRACTETGALCTADGLMLTTAPGHSVPGPAPSPQGQQAQAAPLAAGFVSVPPEHDGETAFWLELSFNAAVEQGSKPRIRALLGVTGGSETRIRRKDGRLDHWRVRAEPSGNEAVTVSLSPSPACGQTGAVCTSDGRTFTTALATRIQGPPGLTVADAEVEQGPNATLAFAVTLSRVPSGTVRVDYATADGTATAGSDYTATSGTLTFAAGETEKTVSVAVLDDAHDEGSETLTLTLSTAAGAYLADGTAIGTITNSDPMPEAWLARFGRTAATHVTDAVGERLRASPGQESQVTVGGYRLPLEKRASGGAEPEVASLLTGQAGMAGLGLPQPAGVAGTDPRVARPESDPRLGQSQPLQTPRLRDVLLGSSFRLNLGDDAGPGHLRLTAWGRVAGTRFDGKDGEPDPGRRRAHGHRGRGWRMGPAARRRRRGPQPGHRRAQRPGPRRAGQYPDEHPSLPALCRYRAAGRVGDAGVRLGRVGSGAGRRRLPGDGHEFADGIVRRPGHSAGGRGDRRVPTGHAHGRHAHAHDLGCRDG